MTMIIIQFIIACTTYNLIQTALALLCDRTITSTVLTHLSLFSSFLLYTLSLGVKFLQICYVNTYPWQSIRMDLYPFPLFITYYTTYHGHHQSDLPMRN